MDPDKQVNRRRFFREGLRELLKPLAGAIEPLHEAAKQLERFEQIGSTEAVPTNATLKLAQRFPLRPPGALHEAQFMDTCSRCGECVRVCPADCIKIDPGNAKSGGAPFIEPNVMPCVVCDGLQCMHHCPTGALVPIPLADIDMGTAVWNSETCLRRSGENCTICVDRCPIGTVAIDVKLGQIAVNPQGCTGCGVCQFECPTSPKSIVVIPIAAKHH